MNQKKYLLACKNKRKFIFLLFALSPEVDVYLNHIWYDESHRAKCFNFGGVSFPRNKLSDSLYSILITPSVTLPTRLCSFSSFLFPITI